MTSEEPAATPATDPKPEDASQAASSAPPAEVAPPVTTPAWRPSPKQIAAMVAVALICLVIIIYLMPRQPMVTRIAEVAVPPQSIFGLISDLRSYPDWAPWLDGESADQIVYTGPTEGVGQTMAWPAIDGLPAGKAAITGIAGERVDLTVERTDERPLLVSIAAIPAGEGVQLIWRVRPDLGFSPVARVLGLWVDGEVGPEIERGLAQLKAVAEKPPEPPPAN